MARNVIESDFRSSKMQPFWIPCSHFVKFKKKAIESDFRSSKMAAGSHFLNTILKKSKLYIDLKWREMLSKVIFGHPKWGGGGASQWPACKPFGDIHSICPWANTPILAMFVFVCHLRNNNHYSMFQCKYKSTLLFICNHQQEHNDIYLYYIINHAFHF